MSIIDMIRPYYLTHFITLKFWQSAHAIDLDFVWNDPYYRNYIQYRKEVLIANSIKGYYQDASDMGKILRLIDDYLN